MTEGYKELLKWGQEKRVPFSSDGAVGLTIWEWELYKALKRDPSLIPAWENGTVLACLRWLWRTFPEAPFVVYGEPKDGEPKISKGHKLTKLVKRPNSFYSGRTLWGATLMSYVLDGNAYWYKNRSGNSGDVTELWWLPHQLVAPAWDDKGTQFITHYKYFINQSEVKIPVQDIVHFRDGVDPNNNRKGLSPMKALVREVLTDNEAAAYTYSILKNGGVMNLIVTPKEPGQSFSAEARRELERRLSGFAGDDRGKGVVLSAPVSLEKPPMIPPEQLALDKLRSIPANRICTTIGFDPMLLGLPSDNKTYSNYRECREAAYESYVIPLQGSLAETIDLQLLYEVERSNEEHCSGFDISNVRVLQEDKERLYRRAVDTYIGGVVKRNEARAILGLDSDAKDAVYYTDIEGSANQRLRSEMESTNRREGGTGNPNGKKEPIDGSLVS